MHLRAVGNQRRQRIGRWRRAADIAHHRGAVAHLDRGEVGHGFGQAGVVAPGHVGGFHLPRGDQRADAQALGGIERQHVHARDLLDVDDAGGLAVRRLDLHEQVGAARQHAGAPAAAVQQRGRFGKRGGFEVFKRSHRGSCGGGVSVKP
ncbi:hypothetical protein D3C81_1631500 [compost metagenome]